MRRTALAFVLAAAAASAPRAATAAGAAEEVTPAGAIPFEEPPSGRWLAFGPSPLGDTNLSLDVGWLRSGLRADIGMGFDLDLVVRADTFLLQDRFAGQTGAYAGLRFSPIADDLFHLSVTGEVGEVFIPQRVSSLDNFVLRGEVTAGLELGAAGLFYVRGAVRAIRSGGYGYEVWGRDEEAGVGYEHRLMGKVLLGAEAFAWARPLLTSIPQWRLRLGYAF